MTTAKIHPPVEKPLEHPVTLWITGFSGCGKTWVGDYLENVQQFHHIDGDSHFMKKNENGHTFADDIKVAFYSYWLQDRPAPEKLWQAYYDALCAEISEFRKANPKKHIVCTFSTYPRIVRDYVRARVPDVQFVILDAPKEEVVKRYLLRNIKAAECFDQEVSEFTRNTTRAQVDVSPELRAVHEKDPFDWEAAVKANAALVLNGLEPAGSPATAYDESADEKARSTGVSPSKEAREGARALTPEPQTWTIDASDEGRGEDGCGIARALNSLCGLGPLEPLTVGVDADGHVTVVEDVTSPNTQGPGCEHVDPVEARKEALKAMAAALCEINYSRWRRLSAAQKMKVSGADSADPEAEGEGTEAETDADAAAVAPGQMGVEEVE